MFISSIHTNKQILILNKCSSIPTFFTKKGYFVFLIVHPMIESTLHYLGNHKSLLMVLPKKIILVEDNMADVELAKLAFQSISNDLEIEHLLDGEELMEFLGNEVPENIVLILLDLNMPRMGGIEVLKRLNKDGELKKLPIIVFTSSNHQADIKKCYDLGANAYVNKPIDFSELEKTVETIVHFWLNINVKPHFNKSR